MHVKIDIWLRNLGLERYSETFRENEIDVDVLEDLTEGDLKELGIPLGDRKRMIKASSTLEVSAASTNLKTESLKPKPNTAPDTQAERRQLTVMFVDLVGSTELSSQLDPEMMRDVIRKFQNSVAGEVSRFGGYIAKFMGDGILAYFGFPQAHEYDVEKSITAGLAIVKEVEKFTTPDGKPLMVRVGIATGLVVVGDLVGEAEARERDVIGQTPNLAARLQSLAQPGLVVVAGATRDLAGNLFDFNQIDVPPLKGISGSVEAYEVLGERMTENRFYAYHAGPFAPIIGREQELSVLIERWRQSMDGECQVVLLTGEAGIGKSRITNALLDALAPEPHALITLQCSPFDAESALYPVKNMVIRFAEIGVNDTNNIKLDKLEAFFENTVADGREAAWLFGRLLGLEVESRYGKLEIMPQQLRNRALQLISDYVLSLAREMPLLLILEDVQWIDPTSLASLEHTLAAISNQKVLVLLTSRPSGQPQIPNYPYVTLLSLNRLDKNQTSKIANNITGGKPLPPELLDEIIAKTDGVPLFVEELTKMVIESGLLEKTGDGYLLSQPLSELSIPSSLQGSLMARLDKLPTAKSVAQTAACVGREFDYKILNVICTESGNQLDIALDELLSADMIYRHDNQSDKTYRFKHALVCDTAYESLLKSKRKDIHTSILEALQAEEAPPEMLAHHHDRAGQPLEAASCLLEAGRKSLEISAGQEAVAYFQRGIKLVQSLTRTVETDRLNFRLHAFLGTSNMLVRGWGSSEVEQSYAQALTYSDAAVDVREKIWILWGVWVFRQVRGEINASIIDGQRVMDIAEQAEDSDALLVAQVIQMQEAFYQGRCQDIIAHGAEIERLYDPGRHDVLKDAYSLDLLLCWKVHEVQAYLLMGDATMARQALIVANERAESLDHSHSKIWAVVWGANFHLMAGETDIVLSTVPEAIDTAERYGFDYVANMGRLILAAAHIPSLDSDQSVHELDKAIEGFRATGAGITVPYFQTFRAQALRVSGKAAEALESIDEVLQMISDGGEHWCEPFALRIKGDILVSPSISDLAAGRAVYQQAISSAKSRGAVLWRLQAELALARLYIFEGKIDRADALIKHLETNRKFLASLAGASDKDDIIEMFAGLTHPPIKIE